MTVLEDILINEVLELMKQGSTLGQATRTIISVTKRITIDDIVDEDHA